MRKDKVDHEFASLITYNYFPQPNDGAPPPPQVADLPRREPERPERKSLMPLILGLATILGVLLIAYGYVNSTGFTLNDSQRPAVECADIPDGGVMCRRPQNG